jgi:hypothetical protein
MSIQKIKLKKLKLKESPHLAKEETDVEKVNQLSQGHTVHNRKKASKNPVWKFPSHFK